MLNNWNSILFKLNSPNLRDKIFGIGFRVSFEKLFDIGDELMSTLLFNVASTVSLTESFKLPDSWWCFDFIQSHIIDFL